MKISIIASLFLVPTLHAASIIDKLPSDTPSSYPIHIDRQDFECWTSTSIKNWPSLSINTLFLKSKIKVENFIKSLLSAPIPSFVIVPLALF